MDRRLRILITGGKGYIASSIYQSLKLNYNIQCISRDDFDLTDSVETDKFFKGNYFDIVIHTAVKGGSRLKAEDSSVIEDNLRMYYNILKNKNQFNKFIHFGSGAEVYAADTPYGLSKRAIADSMLEKDNFYNLRIYAVFDENELDSRFIKANIKRYINKEPIQIHHDKYMSFFYMKDLIKVVEYYITNTGVQKQLDCCYSHICTLSVIANMINSLCDYKVEIIKQNPDSNNGYFGSNLQRPNIDYLGLEYGIKEVYKKLK
jgi:nucleoside-diphosphate-sugar epimerase